LFNDLADSRSGRTDGCKIAVTSVAAAGSLDLDVYGLRVTDGLNHHPNRIFDMREEIIMKLAFRLLVFMFALAFAGSAFATTTAGGTLTVTANIATSCTINSPTLAFGTYDPQVTNLTAAKNSQIDLVWTCTSTTPATIWLDEGANAKVASTPAIPQRQMASGALRLAYFLYSDEGMGTVWGNTIATSVPVTGSGASQNSTVFGSIPGAQNVAPGAFSDTVVVNLKY
jgi:spore coat protein U-like protein